MDMQQQFLPLQGIRVLERSNTLAVRLAGLLLADQGAEVFALDHDLLADDEIDAYLDRGKKLLRPDVLDSIQDSDIVIQNGPPPDHPTAWVISLGFTATVPGDPDLNLPDDASDDLLNALVGFYTDLGITSRLLGRDVIYTPLPLCSVYAAVLGATAVLAALTDRQRSGMGRSIVVPRLSAGLSAIGVLAMDLGSIAPHLLPHSLLALPPALVAEVPKARASEAQMVAFINRLNPTSGCYRTADGQLIMPVTTVNRRLAVRMLELLELWDRAQALGIVNASPYDPANVAVADRNIAQPERMRSDLNDQLALWITEAFAKKSAVEWDVIFSEAQVPCGVVQDFSEWMRSSWVKEAGLVESVSGFELPQLGRAINVKSAKPYPTLRAGQRADAVVPHQVQIQKSQSVSTKPLTGYLVLDLCNVIAGPACGRLLGELGASVIKLDSTRPDHQPLVTVVWGAEANQGKKSLLADLHTLEGREILERLVSRADIVLMNETDNGVRRLGLTQAELAKINPHAIAVQISACKGSRPGSYDDHPGYDPLLQAETGIMTRFGTRDMPLLHGIASCVDYLTGYLGAYATVVALLARERRGDGQGDWAETSLASAASLIQLGFQYGPGVASELGPTATGRSATSRLYKVTDGWIYVEGPSDVAEQAETLSMDEANTFLRTKGVRSIPVQSIAALKEKYLAQPSATIRFRTVGRDGLRATLLEPTWFQFEGKALLPSEEPPRPGGDAHEILSSLGYDEAEIQSFLDRKIVGLPDWRQLHRDSKPVSSEEVFR
jgi:crotonobetainyl-CoA:carnitine CoA-transferase CaiB-like acyl-CoA transferase